MLGKRRYESVCQLDRPLLYVCRDDYTSAGKLTWQNRKDWLDAAWLYDPIDAPVERYLVQAGEVRLPKTHGRRPVAFLNRAWDDVTALDHTVDRTQQHQPLLEQAVNYLPCRCAGHPEAKSELKSFYQQYRPGTGKQV